MNIKRQQIIKSSCGGAQAVILLRVNPEQAATRCGVGGGFWRGLP